MPIRPPIFFCRVVVLVVSMAIVFPQRVVEAADPPELSREITKSIEKSPVTDIVLGKKGELRGTVVNTAGQPQIGIDVILMRADGTRFKTATQANGYFVVSSLRSGVYQLTAGESSIACRVWLPESAPPAAVPGLILVSDAQLERGQREFGSLLHSDKVLLALILAGAIAIPIAIISNNDDAS